MKIGLISSALPPAPDAIGDYSIQLSAALAQRGVNVQLASDKIASAAGNDSLAAFDLEKQHFGPLVEWLTRSHGPDVALVQYNPFCWGQRGWAWPLIRALRQAKRRLPQLVLAVMFHETYMMNPSLKGWVMRQWQWRQYLALLKLADARFFSIEPWVNQAKRLGFEAYHLPVGSNLPFRPTSDLRTGRASLNIADDAFVCGAFGSSHPSRPWSWIGNAVRQLSESNAHPVLVYVGSAVEEVRAVCGDVPVIAPGRLSGEDASRFLNIMDVFLSPFVDGVSTRRGSVMAALQHGIPVATTAGRWTDSLFYENPIVAMSPVNGSAAGFAALVEKLVNAPDVRNQFAVQGKAYYDSHFDWPVTATRLVEVFSAIVS